MTVAPCEKAAGWRVGVSSVTTEAHTKHASPIAVAAQARHHLVDVGLGEASRFWLAWYQGLRMRTVGRGEQGVDGNSNVSIVISLRHSKHLSPKTVKGQTAHVVADSGLGTPTRPQSKWSLRGEMVRQEGQEQAQTWLE